MNENITKQNPAGTVATEDDTRWSKRILSRTIDAPLSFRNRLLVLVGAPITANVTVYSPLEKYEARLEIDIRVAEIRMGFGRQSCSSEDTQGK